MYMYMASLKQPFVVTTAQDLIFLLVCVVYQVDEEDRDFRRSKRGTGSEASGGGGSGGKRVVLGPSTGTTEIKYVHAAYSHTCTLVRLFRHECAKRQVDQQTSLF